jgi:hypothetical protein
MKFQKGHKINVGRKCSEETKRKISKANKGKVSKFKGKRRGKEFGKKISKALLLKGLSFIRECEVCNKRFRVPKCREKIARFCSCKCRAKKIMPPIENRVFKKGHIPWNKNLRGWTNGTKAGFQRREDNPSWKGGIAKERDKDKQKLKEWTLNIFKRDNYICQKTKKKGKLNAHHIESYSPNKEFRFDIDNGITLLETEHKKFHKIYGYKNNRQQLEEFLGL